MVSDNTTTCFDKYTVSYSHSSWIPMIDWLKHHRGVPLCLCYTWCVEVTVIIAFLQTVVLGNERESLCFFAAAVRRAVSEIPAVPRCQYSLSQNHIVSSCFCLSTDSSVSQAIHFLPSKCAINVGGLCLKGFAYANDTLSMALRLPLSPVSLWQTWWHAWQSWKTKW